MSQNTVLLWARGSGASGRAGRILADEQSVLAEVGRDRPVAGTGRGVDRLGDPGSKVRAKWSREQDRFDGSRGILGVTRPPAGLAQGLRVFVCHVAHELHGRGGPRRAAGTGYGDSEPELTPDGPRFRFDVHGVLGNRVPVACRDEPGHVRHQPTASADRAQIGLARAILVPAVLDPGLVGVRGRRAEDPLLGAHPAGAPALDQRPELATGPEAASLITDGTAARRTRTAPGSAGRIVVEPRAAPAVARTVIGSPLRAPRRDAERDRDRRHRRIQGEDAARSRRQTTVRPREV